MNKNIKFEDITTRFQNNFKAFEEKLKVTKVRESANFNKIYLCENADEIFNAAPTKLNLGMRLKTYISNYLLGKIKKENYRKILIDEYKTLLNIDRNIIKNNDLRFAICLIEIE